MPLTLLLAQVASADQAGFSIQIDTGDGQPPAVVCVVAGTEAKTWPAMDRVPDWNNPARVAELVAVMGGTSTAVALAQNLRISEQIFRRAEACEACRAWVAPLPFDLGVKCALSASGDRSTMLVLQVDYDVDVPVLTELEWDGYVAQIRGSARPSSVAIVGGHYRGPSVAAIIASGSGWYAHVNAAPICVDRALMLPLVEGSTVAWNATLAFRETLRGKPESACSYNTIPARNGAPVTFRIPRVSEAGGSLSISAVDWGPPEVPSPDPAEGRLLATLDAVWAGVGRESGGEPQIRSLEDVRWLVPQLYSTQRCPTMTAASTVVAPLEGGAVRDGVCHYRIEALSPFSLPLRVEMVREGSHDRWQDTVQSIGGALSGFVAPSERWVDVVFQDDPDRSKDWKHCGWEGRSVGGVASYVHLACDSVGDPIQGVEIRGPDGRLQFVPADRTILRSESDRVDPGDAWIDRDLGVAACNAVTGLSDFTDLSPAHRRFAWCTEGAALTGHAQQREVRSVVKPICDLLPDRSQVVVAAVVYPLLEGEPATCRPAREAVVQIPASGVLGHEAFTYRVVGSRRYGAGSTTLEEGDGRLVIEPPQKRAQQFEIAASVDFGFSAPLRSGATTLEALGFRASEQLLYNGFNAAAGIFASHRLYRKSGTPSVPLWGELRFTYEVDQEQFLPILPPGGSYGVDTKRKIAYARHLYGLGLVAPFNQPLTGAQAESALALGVGMSSGYPIIASSARGLGGLTWTAFAEGALRHRLLRDPLQPKAREGVRPSIVAPVVRWYFAERAYLYTADGHGSATTEHSVVGSYLQVGGGLHVAL